MRRLAKCLSISLGLIGAFLAYRLVALTKDGEMLWFFLDRKAVLTENGKQVDGWLHREWRDQAFLITRTSGLGGRESYLVVPGRGPVVEGCDGWTAIGLPVLPFPSSVSDALPCPGWRLPEHPILTGKATVSSTSLKFFDERGRLLQVRWR